MNYATLLGVLLSAVQPAIGAGAVAANAAAQLQYRREFEQEADYLGARYMRQAGYDPRGMLDFFKKMLDEQRVDADVRAAVPAVAPAHRYAPHQPGSRAAHASVGQRALASRPASSWSACRC